jgi:hypothetical protein
MGHLYVLSNQWMPGLVKIGCTDRTPQMRAFELSQPTGVPGDYRVERSWRAENAAAAEQRVFAALAVYRVRGSEHFQLTVADAVARIEALLPAGAAAEPPWRMQIERIAGAVAPAVTTLAARQLRRHPAGRGLLTAWSMLSRLRR